MNTPDRTTAAAFLRYAHGDVIADSASLQWSGLYVRRFRFPLVALEAVYPGKADEVGSDRLFRTR